MTLGRVRRAAGSISVGAAVLLAAFAGSTVSAASAGSGVVVPSNVRIGGRSYAQWEGAAWEWAIANLRFYDSGVPRGAHCTTTGQAGPVWFLGGDNYEAAGDSIKRGCDVPAGVYLFLDDPSAECSTVEPPPFHATTSDGLHSCARSFGPFTSTLTLDGKRTVLSGFEVTSPVFSFRMPPRNNYLLAPGATSGRGAAYGDPVMLRPLTPGIHTLVRTDSSPRGPTLRFTYELTVG